MLMESKNVEKRTKKDISIKFLFPISLMHKEKKV